MIIDVITIHRDYTVLDKIDIKPEILNCGTIPVINIGPTSKSIRIDSIDPLLEEGIDPNIPSFIFEVDPIEHLSGNNWICILSLIHKTKKIFSRNLNYSLYKNLRRQKRCLYVRGNLSIDEDDLIELALTIAPQFLTNFGVSKEFILSHYQISDPNRILSKYAGSEAEFLIFFK